MQGTLIRYGAFPSQVAFISPGTRSRAPVPSRYRNPHLVLIAGLTEGLLFTSYVQPLSEALNDMGWAVVQAQLSSSYAGFGHSSLNRDASEIISLCEHLVTQCGCSAIVLMGHSTGCNDIARVMQCVEAQGRVLGPASTSPDSATPAAAQQPSSTQTGANSRLPLVGTILQAPVSDCEYLHDPTKFPDLPAVAEAARAMVAAGNGEDIVTRLPEDWGAPPVTARRFLSLYEPLGDDDMFSFALTDEQLRTLLSPVGRLPCLVLASGEDECVPAHLRPGIHQQALRLAAAITQGAQLTAEPAAATRAAEVVTVAGAPHNCEGHVDELVQAVQSFCSQLQHSQDQ